jgi:DNA-binding LacI/PurR family transcriptional regulator
MDEVARIAGVSKSTVSRALQHDVRVKPATRDRIAALARKHGYAVNSNARKLRQKRSNAVAVVIHLPLHATPAWSGPFVFQLLAEVANGLWMRRQDLLLCSPESDSRHAYQDMLASKGVDGIIFLGQGADDEWLLELARTNAPFVVWGSVGKTNLYCTVGSDNFLGGGLVGRRFNALGRNRVLFVGNREHPELGQRWEGMVAALRERDPALVPDYAEVSDFSFETARERIAAHLRDSPAPPPDAVFAGSDEIARAAIMVLQDLGLHIPDDVSVVGYDDAPTAAHMRPMLTTVRQDTRQASNLLVEKLFQMIDGGRPKSATLSTELIVRET